MRTLLLVLAIACTSVAAASAQTAPPTPAVVQETGYIEAVAQSAFGNVTSQSYGVEAGYVVAPQVEVLFEFARVGDATTQDLQDKAQNFAGGLASSGVGVTVREPISFLMVGGKYILATGSKVHPYVLAGAGIARVKHDVVFRVGGVDVTSNLSQFGAVLGGDLSGTDSALSLMGGAGVQLPIGRLLVLDLQLRLNRAMSDPGISVARAGVGFGIRF